MPGTVEIGFEDLMVTDGEEAIFSATLSSETAKYRILKDGVELSRSEKVRIKKTGKVVTVTLPMAQLDDAGFFQIETNGGDSLAELIVEEKQIEFKSGFSDMSVNFDETAEFKCEVSDRDAVGKWFKDGKEVEASDRIEIRDIGTIRKIIINNVSADDQGEYEYRVEGKTPVKLSACLEAIEIIVEKPKDPPKIYLAKSENKEIIVKVGGKVSVDFAISGDPAPKVEWLRDGETLLDEGKRLVISSTKEKSSLAIHTAKRSDTAKYTLRVTSEAGEDNFDIVVKVIDVPSIPGRPAISGLTDESCRCDWTPPLDDGDCEMRGYIVERKKIKAQRWIRLNGELCGYHNFDIRRLVDGFVYQLRVIPVNICGHGEPSEPSEPFTPIAPTSEVTSFRLGRLTDESIELHWRRPAEVGAAGIDGYKVQAQILPGAMGKANANDAKENLWEDAQDKLLDAKTIKIDLDALATGKNYYFRICTVNKAGNSKWVYVGPICCAESIEDPKIVIPRALNKLIKIPVGEQIHLNIPFQGKPKPTVSWQKIEMVPKVIKAPEPVVPEPVAEEKAPVEAAPVETAPADAAPAEAAPADAAPVEAAPAETAPADAAQAEVAPVEAASVETAPVEAAPVEAAPVEVAPAKVTPKKFASRKGAPKKAAPKKEDAPVVVAPVVEPIVEMVEQVQEWPEHAIIRNAPDSTIIHIRSAARWDTGIYRLTITVGDTTVSADIRVAVVDVPTLVRKITVDEIIGASVSLKWTVPKDDGNTDINGYIVEKRDKKSVAKGINNWYMCLDKVRHCHCQVAELITGNSYQFRVRAFNDVGVGAEAFTKEYADILNDQVTWSKPESTQISRDCKPQFTTALNQRNIVIGYNGVIHCALKARPKPTIRWFKNQMEIIDNPKYGKHHGLGVCQLEVRRSKPNDSGTYKVVAENYLGTDEIEAIVIVKEAVERTDASTGRSGIRA